MNLRSKSNIYPVPNHPDGRLAQISDGFHAIGDMKYRAGKGHLGADIMYRKRSSSPAQHPWSSKWYEIPPRTPALAIAEGRVIFAAKIGTGHQVRIDHGDQIATGYFHMSELLVSVGVTVAGGTPVGIVGGSPVGYGLVHLHFDLQIGAISPARVAKKDPGPYLIRWKHLAYDEAWGDIGRASSEDA